MEIEGRAVDIRVSTHRRRRGREGRACGCSTRAARCSGSSSSACRDDMAAPLQRAAARAVRHGDLRRPDRQRQDHHAVRVAGRDQQPRAQHHDDRGPGRVHGSRRSTRSRSTSRPASPSPAACKSILRQDPDVILVGEIRDVETARIAVQSALTGHFVLSSLHATDAVVGAAPAARHGHRGASSIASSVTAVRRPAAGAAHLHPLPRALRSRRRRSWRSSHVDRRPARRSTGFVRGHGLQLLRPDRLPGADRRLRDDAGHRRGPGADRRPRPARRDAQGRPQPRACARCRRRRRAWSRAASTTAGRGHAVDLRGRELSMPKFAYVGDRPGRQRGHRGPSGPRTATPPRSRSTSGSCATSG